MLLKQKKVTHHPGDHLLQLTCLKEETDLQHVLSSHDPETPWHLHSTLMFLSRSWKKRRRQRRLKLRQRKRARWDVRRSKDNFGYWQVLSGSAVVPPLFQCDPLSPPFQWKNISPRRNENIQRSGKAPVWTPDGQNCHLKTKDPEESEKGDQKDC